MGIIRVLEILYVMLLNITEEIGKKGGWEQIKLATR